MIFIVLLNANISEKGFQVSYPDSYRHKNACHFPPFFPKDKVPAPWLAKGNYTKLKLCVIKFP